MNMMIRGETPRLRKEVQEKQTEKEWQYRK
jgi:hypothetical protein